MKYKILPLALFLGGKKQKKQTKNTALVSGDHPRTSASISTASCHRAENRTLHQVQAIISGRG